MALTEWRACIEDITKAAVRLADLDDEAQKGERLRREKIAAYDHITTRFGDAANFVDSVRGALGKNVWHVVLDEAIRLREENEKLKERPADVATSLLLSRITALEDAFKDHRHAIPVPLRIG